jgi:hypothetical protein
MWEGTAHQTAGVDPDSLGHHADGHGAGSHRVAAWLGAAMKRIRRNILLDLTAILTTGPEPPRTLSAPRSVFLVDLGGLGGLSG